jgi:hypothetical protein
MRLCPEAYGKRHQRGVGAVLKGPGTLRTINAQAQEVHRMRAARPCARRRAVELRRLLLGSRGHHPGPRVIGSTQRAYLSTVSLL